MAIWQRGDRVPDGQPVVLMGSEGQTACVGTNAFEFVALLSGGVDVTLLGRSEYERAEDRWPEAEQRAAIGEVVDVYQSHVGRLPPRVDDIMMSPSIRAIANELEALIDSTVR